LSARSLRTGARQVWCEFHLKNQNREPIKNQNPKLKNRGKHVEIQGINVNISRTLDGLGASAEAATVLVAASVDKRGELALVGR
jgi:hypothetical protein